VGLVVAAAIQVNASVATAREAERTKVLIEATTAVARLVDQIEQEIAETNALRERGGVVGGQLLTAQRARTDRALAAYLSASRAALAVAPEISRPNGHVTSLIDPFARSRHAALSPDVRVYGFGDATEQINLHLLDLAAAIAEQITEPELANLARSVHGTAELQHLAAQQRDLLRLAFTRRELPPEDLVRLAGLNAEEEAKRSEFTHTATETTRARFVELLAVEDVETAQVLRDAVLEQGGAPGALAVDVDTWYIAQSGTMRRLRTLELELIDSLVAGAQRHHADAQVRAALAGLLAAAVVGGTLTGAGVLAARTTRRLRRLRQSALAVAQAELPLAVAQVASAGSPERVRSVMNGSHQRVGALMDPGVDEVAEVSSALGVVHQQALRLAAEQALLRLEVSALFVALARRGRSLVYRQLEMIDDFERNEADPNNLERLFALDHLAARMRRNEENLLVLAGGEPGRGFDRPVVLTDVIRAASAEIEEYARVDTPGADDIWVAAHAAGDVIHLLAELLDNAASFSPPTSRVRVTVDREGDGALVAVSDTGIGMTDVQLVESNRRLSRPTALTSALVGTMGLLVVARLAARHGLRVHLRRNSDDGTTAELRLHRAALATAPPDHVPPLAHPTPPIAPVFIAARARTPAAPPAGPAPVSGVPAPVSAAPVSAAPGSAAPGSAAPGSAAPGSAAPGSATPVSAAPVSAAPAGGAPAGASPVSGAPVNGAPVDVDVTAGTTVSGLPVRRPGAHVRAAAMATGAAAAPPESARIRATPRPADADTFLDPETVRARLSSLAAGIDAAGRRAQPQAPPGASSGD
jgi:signal transduction histidine kinase